MENSSSNNSVGKTRNWLDAHHDNNAGIHTFSQCMALADLNNDGDSRLIIASVDKNYSNMKLKIFKGISLVAENLLLDLPVALVAFHMDLAQPRIPAIAVASGPHIYIYKNMRPYFKFSLPSLEIHAVERDVWMQVRDSGIHLEVLCEMLASLCHELGFSELTGRSQQLLVLKDPTEKREFVERHKSLPLKKQTVVTCMTTLKKCMPEEDAVSCLVLGTESKHVYILDSEAFTILDNMKVPDVPALLAASGLRDVEFRLIIGCRNRCLALVRRGWREARSLVQLPAQAVALTLAEGQNTIVAALMDSSLRGYSKKGKELWRVSLPSQVRTMIGISLPQQSTWVAAVGFSNGHVQFYLDSHLVDSLVVPGAVSALCYGTYGLGESCLTIITSDGSLFIKILRRTATFNSQLDVMEESVPQQFQIPKKTKLFVEQTMRERDNVKSMHRNFQHELLRLKLRTSRACVETLSSCSNPISRQKEEAIRLSAQVLGLGPTFKMSITLHNMSSTQLTQGLAIVFHYDSKIFSVTKPFVLVPVLVSGTPYQLNTLVKYVAAVPQQAMSGVVRVLVVKELSQQPLLAALIHMPLTDTGELPL